MDVPDSPLWQAVEELLAFVRADDRWSNARLRSHADGERYFASWAAVEDTERALEHAKSTWSSHRSLGERYLAIYGALQAMYVQQDSVLALVGLLTGSSKPPKPEKGLPERVQEFRDARNGSIGHPSERGGNLVMGRVMDHMPLMTVLMPVKRSDAIEPRHIEFDVREWVEEQRRLLAKLLRDEVSEQQRIEYEHRMKFSDQPLLPLAQELTRRVDGIGTDLDKDGDESGGMLEFYCGQSQQALDNLESAFSARGELKPNEARIGHCWEHARFALNELRDRFGSRPLRDPERIHARAYHALGERCAATLLAEATAIDKRYSKLSSDSAESVTVPKS